MEEYSKTPRAIECPEPVEGMFFVYILLCKDKSFYCGSTSNVKNRLQEHSYGEAAFFTKIRRPVQLVYCEWYTSLVAARRREKQLKGWTRMKKLKLIYGTWKKMI